MTSETEQVLAFKTKFASFFLDAEQKKQVTDSFEEVVRGIPADALSKAAFYADMYEKGNTDSEKIYFSRKTFEILKPFFSGERNS